MGLHVQFGSEKGTQDEFAHVEWLILLLLLLLILLDSFRRHFFYACPPTLLSDHGVHLLPSQGYSPIPAGEEIFKPCKNSLSRNSSTLEKSKMKMLMSSAYSILHIVMISKRFNTLLLTCCWKPCRQAMLSPEFARFEKSRRLSMGRRFGTLCVARFIVIRRCSRWWWSSSNQRVGELCFQMLSGCRVGDTYYVWKSMFRELCMIKILSV